MLCGALPLCVPVGGGPPARRPRRELRSACRLEARPGPATAHGHRSLALPPPTGTAARPSGYSGALHSRLLSLTGGAGNSRETVITFAGVCSVSGETDDTIASQIHLFLVLFHRAKASWVSRRRTEAPALVLAVSSCGAVSSMGATKFAQRRLSMAIARKYSPSAGKMAQNGRFMACWASFFAEMAHMASRWASFFAPTGTVTRPRSPPSTLKPGRPLRHSPSVRRNWPCTRIGYCDVDRL